MRGYDSALLLIFFKLNLTNNVSSLQRAHILTIFSFKYFNKQKEKKVIALILGVSNPQSKKHCFISYLMSGALNNEPFHS